MNLHKHYPTNNVGRDFIIGDLHGCYDELMTSLKLVKFCTVTDRLFSVGDLVDRGPKSLDCVYLLCYPWFKSVLGNHEETMIKAVLDQNPDSYLDWINNGGKWHHQINNRDLVTAARILTSLPLVITVGSGSDRFNIVHAELVKLDQNKNPVLFTDKMIDDWELTSNDYDQMISGRMMIRDDSKQFQDPDNLSTTFVGHTSVRYNPVKVEQTWYIDTGINYSSHSSKPDDWPLTLACWTDKTFYLYKKLSGSITGIKFDDLKD